MSSVDLPAQLPPITIKAGDAWDGFRFRVKDDQDPAQPIDLPAAGWTDWRCQFRPSPGSGQFVELTVDDSDAANGWIGVSATGAMTQQMGGDGGFDVQCLRGDGEPKTWVECKQVTWWQDYTR